MSKWIATLMCAFVLTACGAMSPAGYSDSSEDVYSAPGQNDSMAP